MIRVLLTALCLGACSAPTPITTSDPLERAVDAGAEQVDAAAAMLGLARQYYAKGQVHRGDRAAALAEALARKHRDAKQLKRIQRDIERAERWSR